MNIEDMELFYKGDITEKGDQVLAYQNDTFVRLVIVKKAKTVLETSVEIIITKEQAVELGDSLWLR
jgi:hypothetical protein